MLTWTYAEVHRDLFECSSTSSMAHCVNADFHMGQGIATHFRHIFGNLEYLQSQSRKLNNELSTITMKIIVSVLPGGVAVLPLQGQCIYYLGSLNLREHYNNYFILLHLRSRIF